jgi:hypothetical protein
MKEKLFDEQEPLGAVPARKFTFGDQPAAKANEPGAENNASPAAEKPADDEYLCQYLPSHGYSSVSNSRTVKKKYPWEVDYLELLPNFGDFLGEGTYAEGARTYLLTAFTFILLEMHDRSKQYTRRIGRATSWQ